MGYIIKNKIKEEQKGIIFPLYFGWGLALIKLSENTLNFTSRVFRKRWQEAIVLTLVLIVTGAGIFFYYLPKQMLAAGYSFSQTDWSGGADTNATASHPLWQTGWDKYYSKDELIAAGTELNLISTTSEKTQTATEDFNAGTTSNAFVEDGKVYLTPPQTATITTDGDYTIYAYLSSGYFNPNSTGSVEVLVVAGGGAGGRLRGGGGGAGGVIYESNYLINSISIYNVIVGTGGLGRDGAGGNGVTSTFDTLAATGGGGGAGSKDTPGRNGGSGGGGASATGGTTAGAGIVGQGNNGGSGYKDSTVSDAGGGGGGAGGVGESARTDGSGHAGDGGVGVYYGNVFGTSYGSNGWFGGGGGGDVSDTDYPGGDGGTGGGGRGYGVLGDGTVGTANTGGGGGGNYSISGKNGGSGIVLIKFLTADFPNVNSYEPW